MNAMLPRRLADRLEAALACRAALLADPQTDVARVLNGAADGIPGLVLEKLGPVLIAQCHAGRLALDDAAARAVCAAAAERLAARAVYRKVFPRDRSHAPRALERLHHQAQPWIGTPAAAELPVREDGLTFLVRPYDGYATGLFLDHRAGRARVRALARGRRVLSTFAYTCGYAVAAAAGGAALTVSVDIARRFLDWGRRNLAANGLPLEAQRFLCADARAYCRRALRRGLRFDLVILDPPTFARPRRGGRPFVLAEDLGPLVETAVGLLGPGGLLLLAVNQRSLTLRRLEEVVRAAAARHRRRVTRLDRLPLPEDFRGDPDHAKAVLARVS